MVKHVTRAELRALLKLNQPEHAVDTVATTVSLCMVDPQCFAAKQGWSIVLKHGGEWTQTSSNVFIFL